jgi:hypothetical protein
VDKVLAVDWRETRFRLVTGFFGRVYAPALLLFWIVVLLGAIVWLAAAVL